MLNDVREAANASTRICGSRKSINTNRYLISLFFFTDYFKSFRFPTISIFFLSYPFFTPLKDVATLYTLHLYSVVIFSTTNQSLRTSGDPFSSLIFFDDNTMSSFLSFVYLYSVVILGTINLRIFFLDFRLSLSFSCFFFIFPSISLRYVFYACIH